VAVASAIVRTARGALKRFIDKTPDCGVVAAA
jgi:hypothetical protein